MSVRLTRFSIPFGGVSRERKSTANEGLLWLVIELESRMLITYPYQRKVGIHWEEDSNYCAQSALDLKSKITLIVGTYDFSNKGRKILMSMIDDINTLLDELAQIKHNVELVEGNNKKRFLNSVKQYKEKVSEKISALYEIYGKFLKNKNFDIFEQLNN